MLYRLISLYLLLLTTDIISASLEFFREYLNEYLLDKQEARIRRNIEISRSEIACYRGQDAVEGERDGIRRFDASDFRVDARQN